MSRRPPSLRNAEYGMQQLARQNRSMIPGTAGGRLASASPLRGEAAANLSDETETSTDSSTIVFAYDRFPSTGTFSSTQTTVTLTYVPAASSLHLYLNGLLLDEGSEYTLADAVVTLATSLVGAGDTVTGRYAYLADVPDAVTDVATISDTFDRANSTTTINPRSDGGLWTVRIGTAGINANAGYFPSGEARIYVDLGAAEQDVTVTNSRSSTAGASGILLNYDPAAATSSGLENYGYNFNFDSSASGCGLANGPQTSLNAGVIANAAWTGGSTTLRLTSDGNGTIKVYQDGTLIAQLNPNVLFTTLTGTYICLWTSTSGAGADRWNNFTAS